MKNEFTFQIDGDTKTVVIDHSSNDLTVTVDDRDYRVTVPTTKEGVLYFSVDGQRVRASVAKNEEKWYVHLGGRQWVLTRPASARSRRGATDGAEGSHSGLLMAAMPGQVLDVLVEVGESVERGQALVLLEAMKMELRITAPYAGVVTQVHCTRGQTVDRDQPLVEIEVQEV